MRWYSDRSVVWLSDVGRVSTGSNSAVVWFPDPSTHKIRACAYNACACEKEGSGPNAGPGILISVGETLVLSGC